MTQQTEVTPLQARVRERMEALGLNPFSAAKRAGLQADFVRNILRGRAKQPSAERLSKLAEALQVSVPYLMGLDDPAPPNLAEGLVDARALEMPRPLEPWTPERGKPGALSLPIRFELMTDAFRRASELGKALGYFAGEIVPDPSYVDREQWYEIVRDSGADLVAPAGSLLQVAKFSDADRHLLNEGDVVVIERHFIGAKVDYYLVERSVRVIHRRYPDQGLWFFEYASSDEERWGISDDLFRDERLPMSDPQDTSSVEAMAELAASIRSVKVREGRGGQEATPEAFVDQLTQQIKMRPRVVAKVLRAIIPIDARARFAVREGGRQRGSGTD